jgi:hypothetical protein
VKVKCVEKIHPLPFEDWIVGRKDGEAGKLVRRLPKHSRYNSIHRISI